MLLGAALIYSTVTVLPSFNTGHSARTDEGKKKCLVKTGANCQAAALADCCWTVN